MPLKTESVIMPKFSNVQALNEHLKNEQLTKCKFKGTNDEYGLIESALEFNFALRHVDIPNPTQKILAQLDRNQYIQSMLDILPQTDEVKELRSRGHYLVDDNEKLEFLKDLNLLVNHYAMEKFGTVDISSPNQIMSNYCNNLPVEKGFSFFKSERKMIEAALAKCSPTQKESWLNMLRLVHAVRHTHGEKEELKNIISYFGFKHYNEEIIKKIYNATSTQGAERDSDERNTQGMSIN